MADDKHTAGWVARRRDTKRLKRERTGDTPQKLAERKQPASAVSSKEAIARTGVTGFLSGGV
jgi:hypothetical protein